MRQSQVRLGNLVLVAVILIGGGSLRGAISPENHTPSEKQWKRVLNPKLDWNQRWAALMNLSPLEASSSKVFSLIQSKEWFLRSGALVYLDKYDPTQAKAAARILMSDPALMVRSQAVQVLSRNLLEEDRPLLWQSLSATQNFRKQKSLWIRPQIAKILAEKPVVSEFRHWHQLGQDTDATVKQVSVTVFQKLGPSSSLQQ